MTASPSRDYLSRRLTRLIRTTRILTVSEDFTGTCAHCRRVLLASHLCSVPVNPAGACLLASDSEFPPKIVNLVRVFHENVTLEVDLDDVTVGNTIIIKYDIGVKQGDTLAPALFLCYIQAVLETLFPKFEAAGIEKLKFRSMQP